MSFASTSSSQDDQGPILTEASRLVNPHLLNPTETDAVRSRNLFANIRDLTGEELARMMSSLDVPEIALLLMYSIDVLSQEGVEDDITTASLASRRIDWQTAVESMFGPRARAGQEGERGATTGAWHDTQLTRRGAITPTGVHSEVDCERCKSGRKECDRKLPVCGQCTAGCISLPPVSLLSPSPQP
ncbi:hypothetical protein M231_00757 [Tremella mesenterica]|uniref:Zn(2)-C6 fungal-type domain-containing protein n=1 Tax=Tremella mesenterica TaxID=5217 RepID=A0A4Q1BVI1_TREME|nr:hypothetical protein M231_00757 [Tremella mesenterica]